MKRILTPIKTGILTILLGTAVQIEAQQVVFDQVVAPVETRARSFEDYLVQLAWMNSPQNKGLELKKQIEEKEVKIARTKWTDEIKAGFNLNEVSYYNIVNRNNQAADNIFVAFPLYSFNASVSLGTLLNNHKKREIEEIDVLIADTEINQQKLAVRAEVLAAYNDYLLAEELLDTRIDALEDATTIYKLNAELYKSDKVEIEEYNRASTNYYQAKESKIKGEGELRLAIVKIEELIGIDWEVAQRYNE